MHLNTDGLVIREQNTGESDRLVTILTRDYGIIRAFVRGARNIKSKSLSGSQLLCYSRFNIYRGRDSYIIDEIEPKEIFFGLRNDIEKLSLAQYFAELCGELAPEEDRAEDYLRLALNALKFLCDGTRNSLQIKATLEMRLMCMSGYMPNLIACEKCGAFESDTMTFDMEKGCIYCDNCVPGGYGIVLDKGIITSMRYICFSEFNKIFNFTLSETGFKILSDITEKYVLLKTQRKFRTLDFYKSIAQ